MTKENQAVQSANQDELMNKLWLAAYFSDGVPAVLPYTMDSSDTAEKLYKALKKIASVPLDSQCLSHLEVVWLQTHPVQGHKSLRFELIPLKGCVKELFDKRRQKLLEIKACIK